MPTQSLSLFWMALQTSCNKNYSVPKDDPVHDAPTAPALYTAIKNQMVFCDVVLIMAGKYATYSDWIQPWGSQQISTVVSNAADRLVGWNTNSIVSAIRELDP